MIKEPKDIKPNYRQYILSFVKDEDEKELVGEYLDIMMDEFANSRSTGRAINFGTWYSGMKKEQVVKAYCRYVSEVLKESVCEII